MAGSKPEAPVPYVIRDARPEEVDAIGDLVRAAYAEFEADYPADWERYFAMVGQMERHLEAAQVIVAEHDERLAGTVTFYPEGSRSGQGEWPAGWAGVLRLAVHPDYRGSGIARALMQDCVRRAREAGATALGLHTTEWMGVARAMYERMGFVRDESFDFIPRSGIYAYGYRMDLSQESGRARPVADW